MSSPIVDGPVGDAGMVVLNFVAGLNLPEAAAFWLTGLFATWLMLHGIVGLVEEALERYRPTGSRRKEQ